MHSQQHKLQNPAFLTNQQRSKVHPKPIKTLHVWSTLQEEIGCPQCCPMTAFPACQTNIGHSGCVQMTGASSFQRRICSHIHRRQKPYSSHNKSHMYLVRVHLGCTSKQIYVKYPSKVLCARVIVSRFFAFILLALCDLQ